MSAKLVKREPLKDSRGNEIDRCFMDTYYDSQTRKKITLLRTPWFDEEDVKKIFIVNHDEEGPNHQIAVVFVHDHQSGNYFLYHFYLDHFPAVPLEIFSSRLWYKEPSANFCRDYNEFLLALDTYSNLHFYEIKPDILFHGHQLEEVGR